MHICQGIYVITSRISQKPDIFLTNQIDMHKWARLLIKQDYHQSAIKVQIFETFLNVFFNIQQPYK